MIFKGKSSDDVIDKAQIIERQISAVEGSVVDRNVASKQVFNKGRAPKQVDQATENVHLATTLDGAHSNVKQDASKTPPPGGPDEERRQSSESITVTAETLHSLPNPASFTSPEDMQKFMLEHNRSPPIYNAGSFAPMGQEDLVLVVQVHKREKYLRLLLESLRHARGVEKVLLVISHDFYDLGVNEAIRSVDFCKVREREGQGGLMICFC